MASQHALTLPLPPTQNLLTRFLVINGQVRPVPSRAYKDWKKRVERLLPDEDFGRYKGQKQLTWTCWYWANMNHQSDLDNRCKAMIDLVAEHHGLSDKWLEELHVFRSAMYPPQVVLLPGWGRVKIYVYGEERED